MDCKYEEYCDHTILCDICKDYEFYFESNHYIKLMKKDEDKKKIKKTMTGKSKSSSWNKKEHNVASKLGATQTLCSGRIFGDGDYKGNGFTGEHKHTDKDKIIINGDWLYQLEREKGTDFGILTVSNNKYTFVIFEYDTMFGEDNLLSTRKYRTITLTEKRIKSILSSEKLSTIYFLTTGKKYIIIDMYEFEKRGGIEGWILKN